MKSISFKEMKVKYLSFLAWLLIPVLIFPGLLSGQASLKDNPSKGEWNFQLEKVWEVDKAGDSGFGRIAELLVSDKQKICVRDFERNVSYLFDENGRFLKTFAPQGAGDGQLSFYLNRFPAGDKIVLAAPDKLHVFSQDGVFERAVANNLFLRFPLYFISENEFIYAPNLPRSPVQEKKLILCDLASGQEKTLVDFSGAEGQSEKSPQGPMLMIPWLTPQVKFGADGKQMVFGRSDQYRIIIADQAGKVLSSFSLDRKRMTASLEDKRRVVAKTRIPEERKEQVAAQLPDGMTFFSHLNAFHGLIYVFAVTDTSDNTKAQRVDIFTEKGEYLYRGTIGFGDHLKFGSPSNLLIKDGYVLVILEDGQGKQTLAKYKIRLPQ